MIPIHYIYESDREDPHRVQVGDTAEGEHEHGEEGGTFILPRALTEEEKPEFERWVRFLFGEE